MQINLKDKLRSLRLQKNITQEALANHLGITPQWVGKWERGEGFPDITLLPRIAFYFDILWSVCRQRKSLPKKSGLCCNYGISRFSAVRGFFRSGG